MLEAFDLLFLDLSDREGVEGIGRFNLHNVRVALCHAFRAIGIVLRHRPALLYIPIDRGLWGFLRDIAIMLPARLLGVRVVAHLRAGRFDLIHDFGLVGRLVARFGLSIIDRMLVLGESLRGIFGDLLPPDRIRVVPNGIDLEAWPPPAPLPHRRTPTIAYLGNLFQDKGAHVMLTALPSIVARFGDVVVEFAGDWVVDEYRRHCLGLVKRLGIARHVRFLGRVDDQEKRDLLQRSDLLVFVPVRPEGSPWVVLEAMAAALPVVGTPQGTMGETIVDGVTGFLVMPDDPFSLADRVIRILRNADLRAEMGRAGRERIEQVFAESRTIERLIDAIAGRNPAAGQSVAVATKGQGVRSSPAIRPARQEASPW